MNRTRHLAAAIATAIAAATLTALATSALPALAAADPDSAPQRMQAGAAPTEGEVRKIDKDAGKVTLKHGEIKSLDMPPMTMVFAVKDRAMLDKLQVGDKVRFKAANEAGRYTVTEIQVVR
jgi:Cu/Ag efflux protein CusF